MADWIKAEERRGVNDKPKLESGFIDPGGKNGEIGKPEVQGEQIPYFIYHINTNVSVINIDP